jgi:hypothetical protein
LAFRIPLEIQALDPHVLAHGVKFALVQAGTKGANAQKDLRDEPKSAWSSDLGPEHKTREQQPHEPERWRELDVTARLDTDELDGLLEKLAGNHFLEVEAMPELHSATRGPAEDPVIRMPGQVAIVVHSFEELEHGAQWSVDLNRITEHHGYTQVLLLLTKSLAQTIDQATNGRCSSTAARAHCQRGFSKKT